MNFKSNFERIIVLFVIFSISALFGFSQTPGLIIRDGSGRVPPGATSTVLDPNGNGWSSLTTAGFSAGDVGAAFSEIPYKPIPPIFPEPTGDLRRGATGFFSEIVRINPEGTGFYMYFDRGADNTSNTADDKILVRLRISGLMSGSKGYSALLDTDGKFFGTGTDADPTYQAQTTGTNGNPGFEYEIVYETNFRIALYDVNNSCNPLPPQLVWSVDLTNLANSGYAQTSVAITRDGGDADYFYDFWIPRTAFTGSAGPITATTPLRAQTTTVMSPQGAICGPVSDLYGDDALFGTSSSQYVATIQGQPTFTLNDMSATGGGVGAVCTAPPAVNAPIASSATSISGTWTKASYSSLTTATITVYKNGVAIGTTSATSGGTWTLTGITVANNDIITAKAQAAGESMCLTSNSVLILDCTPATSTVCPTVTCFTDKGAEGTGIPGATLRIYRVLSTGITVDFTLVIPAGGAWGWAATGSTGNATNVCNTGSKDLLDGTYYVTQQAPGQCESACLTPFCVGFTATATPVITTDPIFTGTSTLTGTALAGSTVRLYLNNVLKATTTATGGNFSFPITSYYAQLGDVYRVTAQGTNLCVSAAAIKTVQCFVSNPVINTTEAGVLVAGAQISGKSSEPVGTTVTVYNGATNAVIGTTTVAAGGVWTLTTPTAVAGTTYYARHTGTPCGASGASATVSTLTGTPATRCGTITGPVNENATSVSGTLTGSVANTLVTLYIDGTSIGTFTTSNTNWGPIAVNTTYLNKIYPGGVLSIGITEPSRAEVICAATVTVACVPPATPTLLNAGGIAGSTAGTLDFTITNSQTGILYLIEDGRTGSLPTQLIPTDRGTSQFGNGGSLTLTTNVLTEPGNYRFTIKAIKLTGLGCVQTATSALVNPYNTTIAVNDQNSTWINTAVPGNVITNDFDIENDIQTFNGFWNGTAYVTTGTINVFAPDGTTPAGTLTIGAGGAYTYTPAAGYTGLMQVSYQVCDNGNISKCETAVLTVTVNPLPALTNSVIANNDENLSYGSSVSGDVDVNDRDPQGNSFTVTAVAGGTIGGAGFTVSGIDENGNTVANAGTLVLNSNGTYTYTPEAGFYGSINVTYTITDALGAIATAVLSIDVIHDANGTANDAPVAGDDFITTNVNTPVTGSAVLNDFDPNAGNTFTVTQIGATAVSGTTTVATAYGTITIQPNGTYTYTPNAGYVGPDRITYVICDNQSPALCNDATLYFLVGVNNTTVAINDENSTFQDVNVSGGVIANDYDLENHTQTFSNFLAQSATPGAPIASGATLSGVSKTGTAVANAGVLTFDASGNYTFDPSPTFTGTVSVPYQVCDNGNISACDTAYLTITVDAFTAVTNSVIANNDENISYGAAVSGDVDINDRDPQGNSFSVTAVSGGTVGSSFTVSGIDLNGNNVTNAGNLVVNANGTYTYTPAAGFIGSISVTYTITDALGATSTAVLQIDVVADSNGAANDAPFAGDDFAYTKVNTAVTANFVANDNDPNGNPLSLNGTTINTAGAATAIGSPVATAQGGTVQFFANGTYTYTPAVGYVGPDRVDYTICDVTAVAPQPLCNTAAIHFLVGVDNSTVAVNDENSTFQDVNVSGGVIANDYDLENHTQTFSNFLAQGVTPGAPIASGATLSGVSKTGTTVANAGVLTFDASGNYSFDPSPTFTGTVTVPYSVCDNGVPGICDTAYLTLTIDPSPLLVNSVIANNDETISYGSAATGNVLSNDKDPQANPITVTAINGIQSNVGSSITVSGIDENGNVIVNAGSLVINADGSYTYTPFPGFYGLISMPYTITDVAGATSTATLTVSVLRDPNGSLNNPPFAGDDFEYTIVNRPVTSNFIGNDRDPNGNSVSVNGVTINIGGAANPIGAPVTTAQGGSVQFYSNGTYLYTPLPGYTGPDQVNYTICDVSSVDPQPLCNTATIHMLVGPVSTLPVTGMLASARLNGFYSHIEWKTETEINSDYFEVERSIDNRTYTTIGKVAASGNSHNRKDYRFSDDLSLIQGVNIIYYRIKQVDNDAKYSYSNIVVVRPNRTTGIKAWPNPFTETVTISIVSDVNSKAYVKLFGSNGQLLQTDIQMVSKGTTQINLGNLNQLPQGTYLLQVQDINGNILFIEKFMKK